MSRHLRAPSFLVWAIFCFLLPLAPLRVGAETLDALLKRAASNPAEFDSGQTLAVLYLAHEVLETEATAAVEQSKPSTDQQTGAPPTSEGSTTLTEKTGIAELLNLAIERGAITKTTSGTSYTLQTTPYLLYSKFGAKDDNRKTWDSTRYLRRIGISATFDQNSGDSSKTGSDFESGEVKYTALGNLSVRDQEIQDKIRGDFQPIGNALAQVTGELFKWANSHQDFDSASENFIVWLKTQPPNLPVKDVEHKLAESLETVRNGFKAEDTASLRRLVFSIANEQNVRTATIQAAVKHAQDLIDQPRPQLSFSYGYQRDATTSDYSILKVLFGYKNAPKLSYNLNGEWEINNKLTSSTGALLERTRAYSVEAGLTVGKFANDSCDLTAAAKWMRPMGEMHSMAFAQAKLNLYLTRGVTIPVAITYANRTEQSDHSSLRFNAGFAIAGDAFLGVARKGNP